MFIAGGFNGQECLNTAEYFDPKTRQWTMIAPMRNRRSGIGVIAHDGFVYAVGGFNGITRMNNGEKYNPITNSWSNITEMYSPRSNFGIEVSFLADSTNGRAYATVLRLSSVCLSVCDVMYCVLEQKLLLRLESL